mgnify:CR=1 FL=1
MKQLFLNGRQGSVLKLFFSGYGQDPEPFVPLCGETSVAMVYDYEDLSFNEDEYADFEVYLAPTYDFIMRLLHTGAMIEVISPASLRQTMKEWISDMYELYKND